MSDPLVKVRAILTKLPGFDAEQVTRALPAYASHAHARARMVQRRLSRSPEQADIRAANLRAWGEALDNLQAWKTRQVTLSLPQPQKILLVGWYFPEVLTLLPAAQQHNVLVLVSQDAPWLDELKQTGHTLNFQAEEAMRGLVEQAKSGRHIFAMLDIIYPGTGHVVAPFFGRPARTASGILELAIRYEYTLAILGPREGKAEIVASIPAKGEEIVKLATSVNQVIEQEIMRAPDRWLMWHALGLRYRDQ